MNEADLRESGASPFSPRAALALVVFGAAVFLALLWVIGAGMATGSTNDGGGHAGGKGLNGYAALAGYLEKRGHAVRRSQSEAALDDPGLLVLTPPQDADGDTLRAIVDKRRSIGPTLIVTPKWITSPVPDGTPGAQRGWVQLAGTQSPLWQGFQDDVGVAISAMGSGNWTADKARGTLPTARAVQSGSGEHLVPLVEGAKDGRILAAYLDDGGIYPALEAMALESPAAQGDDEDLYPVVFVFEPDLLDNYGMANLSHALLAERLVRAAGEDAGDTVIFDLTLNGHARSANLLTLAFTPPFLAATLCLLMAALAVGWRAFLRFGPAKQPVRAIAFGKRALVGNAAGLIRRTRRLHLIAPPYLARVRDRLTRALALPHLADAHATDAAIDRVLAARAPGETPFSQIAARITAARKPQELVKAARELHALERKLTK